MTSAKLELRHIQLELLHRKDAQLKEDPQHLRHFIDQYFCYKNSKYIDGKSGRAKWKAITFSEYVSVKADELRGSLKEIVLKEHVVPLKVITQKLLNIGDKNYPIELIENVLNKYLIFATISKKEDKVLNENGYRKAMPTGFYEPGHIYFDDPFARYKECKIDLLERRLV